MLGELMNQTVLKGIVFTYTNANKYVCNARQLSVFEELKTTPQVIFHIVIAWTRETEPGV